MAKKSHKAAIQRALPDRQQITDDFFDDEIVLDKVNPLHDDEPMNIQVDKQVNQQVNDPIFEKTSQTERKVFSVKVMPWVDKFVDDLVHELDKRGINVTKGEVTEKAFKVMHGKMKREGINVKIRKEFLEEFEDV